MPPAPKPSQRSPVAERIRARLVELGLTESAVAESWGKDRTILSTQLRRVDEGGNLRGDTLQKLSLVLGRSTQWILTGEEPAGVRLADCPGWIDAATEARRRWSVPEESLRIVGEWRVTAPPRHLDAAFVRALTDAI